MNWLSLNILFFDFDIPYTLIDTIGLTLIFVDFIDV